MAIYLSSLIKATVYLRLMTFGPSLILSLAAFLFFNLYQAEVHLGGSTALAFDVGSSISGSAVSPSRALVNPILPTEVFNGNAIGRTDGNSAVTNDGAAIYSMSLWVPAGRGEMQPALALNYSSKDINGLIGMGWTLSGLSSITRCSRTALQDGEAREVRFTNSEGGDRFCLDGQRLAVIGGARGQDSLYGADGTEYRTEQDNHTKVVSYAPDAYGPRYFKIYRRDGKILTFGLSGNSTFEGRRVHVTAKSLYLPDGTYDKTVFHNDYAQNVRYSWAVSSIEDRAGNYVTVNYSFSNTNFSYEQLPRTIHYTGSTANPSVKTSRSVRFIYEPRPDAQELFVGGLSLISTKRLKKIDMLWLPDPHTTTVLRSYELIYRNDSISKRSLLSQIKECDGSKVCMPPTTFEWSLGDGTFQRVGPPDSGPQQPQPGSQLALLQRVIKTGDINGDGRDDLLIREDNRSWSYQLSRGRDFGPVQSTPFLGVKKYDPGGGAIERPGPEGRLIDINTDGRADMILLEGRISYDLGTKTELKNQIYFSTPEGFKIQRDDAEEIGSYTKEAYVLDMNNDGAPELVRVVPPFASKCQLSDVWAYRPNFGGALKGYIETLVCGSSKQKARAIDVNGSGKMSLMTAEWAFGLDSSVMKAESTTVIHSVCGPMLVDVNGDGLSDAVSKAERGVLTLQINTGHGFKEPVKLTIPEPFASSASLQTKDYAETGNLGITNFDCSDVGARVIDYNNDGRQDLLLMAGYKTGPGPIATCAAGTCYEDETRAPRELLVLQSTGSGLTPLPLPIKAGQASALSQGIENYKLSQILDVNGDGQDDFVQDLNGFLRLYIRNGDPADMLRRVLNGLGSFEEYEYLPLSSSNVYRAGTDCIYPQACIKGKMWVVSRHRTDSGHASPREKRYFYEDGRIDLSRPGWIGFAKQEILDPQTEIKTSITFDNQTRNNIFYSCAGFPRLTVTDVPLREALWLGPVPRVYVPRRGDLPPLGHRWEIIGEKVIRRHTTSNVCETIMHSNGKSYFTYPSVTDEMEWEGPEKNPVLLRKNTSRQLQDDYGNVTKAERYGYIVKGGEPVGRAYQVNAIAEYDNFPASWLIGQVKRIQKTSASRSGGQSVTREEEYEYYPDTGLLWKTRAKLADGIGSDLYLQTKVQRDSYGLISMVQREGSGELRTEQLEYDDPDHIFIKAVTNSGGHTKYFRYHAGLGVALATKDENGLEKTYQYDGFGRVRFVEAPDDSDIAIHYRRGAAGEPKLIVQPAGGVETEIAYDRLGREIVRQWEAFNGNLVTTETSYNRLGHIESVSLPHGTSDLVRLRRFDYDNLGRLLSIGYPDGTARKRVYKGLKTQVWDEKGNESYFEEDGVGRVVSTVNVDVKGREIKSHFEYGPFGLLEGIVDAYGRRIAFEYDKLGRRSKVMDLDSGTRFIKYNAFGEIKAETDGNGRETSYIRDALGRPLLVISGDDQTVFTWDTEPYGVGMLAASISPDSIVTQYKYDTLSRPRQTMLTVDGDKYTFDSTYDRFGRLQTLGYPQVPGRSRFVIEHKYTARGEISHVKGANGGPLYWTVDARLPNGRLHREKLGDHIKTTKVYSSKFEDLLRFVETEVSSTGAKIQYNEYQYDDNGNLFRRYDHMSDSMEEFLYDPLNRLKQWDSYKPKNTKITSATYHYDDVGNLLKKAVSGGSGLSESHTYTYGEGGAGVHALTGASDGVGSKIYSYDGGGNQITGPDRTIEYTAFNRPSSVQLAGAIVTFKYDAMLARSLKKSNGESTVYVNGLYEMRTLKDTTRFVFYIKGADRPVAQVIWTKKGDIYEEDKIRYLYDDHLGSVEVISNDSGKVVARHTYEPFGTQHSFQSTASGLPSDDVRLGFTGHEHDFQADLINMKARMYDPEIGRFLSADPVINSPLFGQSYNRYSYVLNNPLSLTDPTGLSVCSSCGQEQGTYNTHVHAERSESPSSNHGSSGPQTGGGPTNPHTVSAPTVSDDQGTHQASTQVSLPPGTGIRQPSEAYEAGNAAASAVTESVQPSWLKNLRRSLFAGFSKPAIGFQLEASGFTCFGACGGTIDAALGVFENDLGLSFYFSLGGSAFNVTPGPNGPELSLGLGNSAGLSAQAFVSQAQNVGEFSGYTHNVSGGLGPVSATFGRSPSGPKTYYLGWSVVGVPSSAGVATYNSYTWASEPSAFPEAVRGFIRGE